MNPFRVNGGDFNPHNNRKRTKGRNYRYVKDANNITRKVWLGRNTEGYGRLSPPTLTTKCGDA